ncbi:hypothetical protein, partial [Acidocella sp.]|uniref:hypothetical protein n=1 Tax=Acidocella sp. TaxID=50710 RepID=UPI0025BD67F0
LPILPLRAGSERQRRRLHHQRQRADLRQHVIGRRLVGGDQADRILAFRRAARLSVRSATTAFGAISVSASISAYTPVAKHKI